MYFNQSVTIFCLILAKCLVAEYLNDECVPNDGIAAGVCKLAEDCEPARRALVNRKPHNLYRCGFQDFSEIVCCPVTTTKFGTKRKTDIECDKILEKSLPPLGVLILGGEEASIGEFPHVVALGYDRGNGIVFDCSGAIISKEYVLTAAHCIDSVQRIMPTVVRAGVINLGSPEWNDETDVGIAQYINHPEYTRREKYHDLSLLRLSRSLEFSSNLNAVCLETSAADSTQPLIITGWGQTSNIKAVRSNTLLKTNVTAVPLSVCSETFNERTHRKLPRGLTKDMMCAGDPTGAHDACQGDSGGPIQVLGPEGQYRVVGVTSFGMGCGSPLPAVYTRISSHLDWIESVVWKN